MMGRDKEPPKEGVKTESTPEPTAPPLQATEDVMDYGVFKDATIEVDKASGQSRTKVSIHRPGGIVQSLEAPTPVVAAWAMDNSAGSLLASAAAVNTRVKNLLDKK